MNKISIITVNFNDKKGLAKTISSITNQTYKDFEFIVIDGGSSDGSKELIENYSSIIDYWVSEPDNGIYNAMNKVIKAAKGEFIIFMNGGDVFTDTNVLSLIDKELSDKYDLYYGDCFRVKADGSKKLKTYPDKLSFSYFYKGYLNHQSTIFRKKLFFDHFLYNEDCKIVADWEFLIYTICKMNTPYKHLPIPIADYDLTGVSSSDKYKDLANLEKQKAIQKYFPLFADDYILVSELNSKRFKQIFHIQNYPKAWTFLKAMISLTLLFVPKIRK
jgi:glycosyltransferase involved in cell wall biosynthesis